MSGVKRIAVFGPESTGKTTLAQRLAAQFGEPWSAEFVRQFWELRKGRIVEADLGTIALGQIGYEEAAAMRARRVVFCDTELLTCTIWNDLLFPGHCPAWVRSEADDRAKGFALYLFCETDAPFAPDPQRCFPDAAGREMCRRLWRQKLDERGLPYVVVAGDWATREQTAIAAVERVLRPG